MGIRYSSDYFFWVLTLLEGFNCKTEAFKTSVYCCDRRKDALFHPWLRIWLCHRTRLLCFSCKYNVDKIMCLTYRCKYNVGIQCPRPERCPEMTAVAYPTLNKHCSSKCAFSSLEKQQTTLHLQWLHTTHTYFESYVNFSSITTKAYFYLTLQPIPTLLSTQHI
jgi:hypothetical protein